MLTEEEFAAAKQRLLAQESTPPPLPLPPMVPPPVAPTRTSQFRGPPCEWWSCGEPLRIGREAKNEGSGCLIIVLGLCLAPVIIGIPIVIYGLHLSNKVEGFWQCKRCDSKFPRKIK